MAVQARPQWLRADISLDLTGESCPIPEITVWKNLKTAQPGHVIEVLTDHQPAVDVTLPALAKGLGYQFYAEKTENAYKVYIEKR